MAFLAVLLLRDLAPDPRPLHQVLYEMVEAQRGLAPLVREPRVVVQRGHLLHPASSVFHQSPQPDSHARGAAQGSHHGETLSGQGRRLLVRHELVRAGSVSEQVEPEGSPEGQSRQQVERPHAEEQPVRQRPPRQHAVPPAHEVKEDAHQRPADAVEEGGLELSGIIVELLDVLQGERLLLILILSPLELRVGEAEGVPLLVPAPVQEPGRPEQRAQEDPAQGGMVRRLVVSDLPGLLGHRLQLHGDVDLSSVDPLPPALLQRTLSPIHRMVKMAAAATDGRLHPLARRGQGRLRAL
mmetsp:Transcript_28190/g.80855  ORF Transcript_28190/g.80855 Transcript_28190/m.80855 type:complete len:297 (-) Transcript_28190:1039-1929(-)